MPSADDVTALGINSSGTVVGNITGNCCLSGYVSANGSIQLLNGTVNAINDSSIAVGASASSGDETATEFQGGIATSLLAQDSSAFGINNAGDVVGFYQPSGSIGPRLFMWDPSAGAVDLTPAAYEWATGLSINSAGQILAQGMMADGSYNDFLLTPDVDGALIAQPLSSSSPTAVPEPGSLDLSAMGAIVALLAALGQGRRALLTVEKRRGAHSGAQSMVTHRHPP